MKRLTGLVFVGHAAVVPLAQASQVAQPPVATLVQAVPAPVTVVSSAVAARQEPSDRTVFRFNVSAGVSAAGLEIEETRKVEVQPDASVYEADPLRGSFQSNAVLLVRTVESVALPIGDERDWIVGAGIEALSSLGTFGRFSRDKASSFSLQIWSACFESGLRRKLSEGQGIEILFGGAYSLGGKAGFSYTGLGDDGTTTTQFFDDRIDSAWRASLMGRYSFRVLSFLEAGLALEGYYGRIDLSSRSKPTAMQGSALHALFAFAIE
jgi:hypothetical protein